nr:DNA adenine methylase [Bacillus thuringiensis]
MQTCSFCFLTGTLEECDFQMDQYNQGFWCELCDGYTYIDEDAQKHCFTLVLENKHAQPINTKHLNYNFSKRLSPYRYPGGKTRIIDYLYTLLKKNKTNILVSPFTGGGSFELAMLSANVVGKLHLNDLDTGVYSFWWIVKHMPYELIDRLESIIPTHKDYFEAQAIIKNDYKGFDVVDAAWASLLVNRLAYSGISKANPLGGKNGPVEKLLSRWNPKELIKRIEYIHSLSENIVVTQCNALELIEEAYWDDSATIFIDPPYVEKGKDLYHCYYTEDDHISLSVMLNALHMGCPGADIIVTYDYSKWLDILYEHPEREIIGRAYSA